MPILLDLLLLLACLSLGISLCNSGWLLLGVRLGVVINSLLNEWGHLLVALHAGAGRRVLDSCNLLGHRPLWTHCAAALPLLPDFRGDLLVHVPGLTPKASARVREHGFALGCGLSVCTLCCCFAAWCIASAFDFVAQAPESLLGMGYWGGTLTALVGAWLTDMAPASPYRQNAEWMACGNVTLMGRLLAGERGALPERCRQLLLAMLGISQMRGAQAGGGCIQVARGSLPRHVIRKCINPKRADLATRLTRKLATSVSFEAAHGDAFLVQAHVRYATAGRTTQNEAHPFRYSDVSPRTLSRVTRWVDGVPQVRLRPVEITLTHNGDMDGLNWRGVHLPYPDVGAFLERMLGVKNRWTGDSPQLAAAIELFVTQGMWSRSLRLAYHWVAAPRPSVVHGSERRAALAAALAAYPVPSPELLNRWAERAEVLTAEIIASSQGGLGPSSLLLRGQLVERLVEVLSKEAHPELFNAEATSERLTAFARAAVDAFFDNDLYIGLRKLEPALLGTFGCVVTSTLEPTTLVVLSRGQPLSLGFDRAKALVCVVSERAAIKVVSAENELAFSERLDLDLCSGELARVHVDSSNKIQLMLYSVRDDRECSPIELVNRGRLVQLRENPYVSLLPGTVSDRVSADIRDTAELLRAARQRWAEPNSPNRASADAFADALFRRAAPRLLVLGITNDLWIGQQLVANLKLLFPHLDASAHSSNAILLADPRPVVDEGTLVLAISQTGQDFPTLGALVLLQAGQSQGNDQFFVMSGETDSLMGQTLGQSYARAAPFSGRIIASESGFRPSEAAFASVNAMHYACNELLLRLAERAVERAGQQGALTALGCELSLDDLERLRQRRDLSVEQNVPALTGNGQSRAERESRRAWRKVARAWSWHVLEGIVAFLLALVVLEVNLRFGFGLLPSRALGLVSATAPEWLMSGAALLLGHADVLFYGFLTPIFVVLLRAAQRRELFHRHAVRELLIGDTRYVHQIAWLFARKLFSLSYGFASIKPYAADCQDELILLHEPVRGTLVLIGLPDASAQHLRGRGGAALMTAKQLSNSRSFAAAGAEIVTFGHGPAQPTLGVCHHIALPSSERVPASVVGQLLVEGMFDSWERLIALQLFLDRMARDVSRFALGRYDRSRTKDQVYAPTTASPVSAAAIYQLLAHAAERDTDAPPESLPFSVARSDWRGSAPRVRTTLWRDGSDSP